MSIIFSVLLLWNMVAIFYYSSMDSSSSNRLSKEIATSIYSQANKNDDEKSNASSSASQSVSSKEENDEQKKEREEKEKKEKEKQERARKSEISMVNNKLRKVMHMLEFASLGFLSILLLMVITMRKMRVNMLISSAFCIAYATSDEIHQLYVDGRSFGVTDIILDSTGVAVGILIGCILFILCKRLFLRNN